MHICRFIVGLGVGLGLARFGFPKSSNLHQTYKSKMLLKPF